MRKSSERHPLAVLRRIIGLSQQEFGKLVGLSESTIAKIESLTLDLSTENALHIQNETGCSAAWLSSGKPNTKPIAAIYAPDEEELLEEIDLDEPKEYTLASFQYVRTLRKRGLSVEPVDDPNDYMIAESIQELLRSCYRATRLGQKNLAQMELYKLVRTFTKEFGISDPWDEGFPEYLGQVLDSVVHITNVDNRPDY